MARIKFATQLLEVDIFEGGFVVVCEHCRKPLEENYVPNGHKAYCSIDCITSAKRMDDIIKEYERCSRI